MWQLWRTTDTGEDNARILPSKVCNSEKKLRTELNFCFLKYCYFSPESNWIWFRKLYENEVEDFSEPNWNRFGNGHWIKCSALQLDLWTNRLSVTLATSQPFAIAFVVVIIIVIVLLIIAIFIVIIGQNTHLGPYRVMLNFKTLTLYLVTMVL